MIITDAQVHLWGPNVPERPWREGQSVPGKPDKPFEIPYVLDAMDAAGVNRAVSCRMASAMASIRRA